MSKDLQASEVKSVRETHPQAAGRRTLLTVGLASLLALLSAPLIHAQGPILSVQPTSTVQTLAGNGTLGYAGDAAAATAASLAGPAAVAYDAAGNLYIADTSNQVIRKVDTTGNITTVAGDGTEGFGGDGGPATSAQLDTPTGIVVDTSGNLYIADSHNQRIRMVNVAGNISTVAGNGTAAFSGDGSAATSASLFLPQAVALDSAGNLYIADTGNDRIRKVSGGVITTVAGDGEQIYVGDGAAATSAGLDTPTGVAVDGSNNIYIADSHNDRIRMVNAKTGNLSTVAGNGTLGFSGDTGSAVQASLALPTGVASDAAGDLYISDSSNNVIRQMGNGVINTVAGNGSEGYGGDGSSALSATFDTPRSAALDPLGNLAIADGSNQRVRAMELPSLTFATQADRSTSASQSLTLSNTGGASLSITSENVSGAFALASGGTCGALPISLAASASCTVNLAFVPTALGTQTGSVVFNGTGITPQIVALSGTGSASQQAVTAITLSITGVAGSSSNPATLTALVTSAFSGVPTGTVSFFDGTTLLGTSPVNASGQAIYLPSSTNLTEGSNSITAVYSGDANFLPSTSLSVNLTDQDFVFSLGQGSTTSQTVYPGGQAIYHLQFGTGTLANAIALSVSGLPSGATYTFVPANLAAGTIGASDILTIQIPLTTSANQQRSLPGHLPAAPLALGLLLLPLAGTKKARKHLRAMPRSLTIFLLAVACLGAAAGLGGCATGTGFFKASAQTSTLTVTATSGEIQHSIQLTLIVE